MTHPTISVIIPVFNNEAYLAEAIESVIAQTIAPFEIIVVDDGSTDGCADLAKKFIPQIRLLRQSNKGISAARNTGIKAANGDYLAFLDADDVWTSRKLEHQIEFLEKHPETEMIFGTVQQFISPELSVDHQNKLRPELKIMPGLVPGASLVRRDNFLRVGFFNETLTLGEFLDWFSRAIDLGLQYSITDFIVLHRRIHTTNAGITKKKSVNEYTRILRDALKRKRDASNPDR